MAPPPSPPPGLPGRRVATIADTPPLASLFPRPMPFPSVMPLPLCVGTQGRPPRRTSPSSSPTTVGMSVATFPCPAACRRSTARASWCRCSHDPRGHSRPAGPRLWFYPMHDRTSLAPGCRPRAVGVAAPVPVDHPTTWPRTELPPGSLPRVPYRSSFRAQTSGHHPRQQVLCSSKL